MLVLFCNPYCVCYESSAELRSVRLDRERKDFLAMTTRYNQYDQGIGAKMTSRDRVDGTAILRSRSRQLEKSLVTRDPK